MKEQPRLQLPWMCLALQQLVIAKKQRQATLLESSLAVAVQVVEDHGDGLGDGLPHAHNCRVEAG